MRSSVVEAEGAQLYCEVRGQGPALLMISGSGGDAGYYAEAAEVLGDAFTVIAYDRRGNSRSTGELEAPTSVSEQAADAAAVIDRLAGGRALVFGNSAGAIIGLALAAEHPEALSGLIAHEPPLVRLLPEGDPWRGFFDEMIGLARDEGLVPAAVRFGSTIHGEGTYAWPADVWKRFAGNRDRIFLREFPALRDFVPGFEALAGVPFPIVMAAGAEDRGRYYATPSLVIAERLGVPWTEFPGYHMPFMERPAAFVAALRAVVQQMDLRSP
ncbi:MAG: hypothetical protein QOF44_4078 [Streptomyces sp.]|nr:hypothetical protein [Streptomyces sp.]